MNKKGFTLIELIVVVIIIGIISAIAAPIMQSAIKKTIVSEAVVTLGTIRSAQRAYHVEHGYYTQNYSDLFSHLRSAGTATGRSDLDGTYFSEEAYTGVGIVIDCSGPNTFSLFATPETSVIDPVYAPRGSQINGWSYKSWGYIIMDETGKVYSDFEGLGYEQDPIWP